MNYEPIYKPSVVETKKCTWREKRHPQILPEFQESDVGENRLRRIRTRSGWNSRVSNPENSSHAHAPPSSRGWPEKESSEEGEEREEGIERRHRSSQSLPVVRACTESIFLFVCSLFELWTENRETKGIDKNTVPRSRIGEPSEEKAVFGWFWY